MGDVKVKGFGEMIHRTTTRTKQHQGEKSLDGRKGTSSSCLLFTLEPRWGSCFFDRLSCWAGVERHHYSVALFLLVVRCPDKGGRLWRTRHLFTTPIRGIGWWPRWGIPVRVPTSTPRPRWDKGERIGWKKAVDNRKQTVVRVASQTLQLESSLPRELGALTFYESGSAWMAQDGKD